jgi:hypothetical protein
MTRDAVLDLFDRLTVWSPGETVTLLAVLTADTMTRKAAAVTSIGHA